MVSFRDKLMSDEAPDGKVTIPEGGLKVNKFPQVQLRDMKQAPVAQR
jgi:hypothetical protein